MYYTLSIKKELQNSKINRFIRINPLKSNSKLIPINLNKLL